LARCHIAVRTSAAGEQELAGPFVGGLEIVIDCLTGLLAQLKSDRPSGFLLSDGCAIRCVPAGSDILDPYGYDIAAAKLAVDRQIEHREVASAALDLEFCPDRPDVFGSQRWLCPGQLSPVPRHSLGRIYLILHDHTPRLGYRADKHEPPDAWNQVGSRAKADFASALAANDLKRLTPNGPRSVQLRCKTQDI